MTQTLSVKQMNVKMTPFGLAQTKSEPMDEQSLRQELACGDSAAFEQLVESHQRRVVNTCYGFVHNKEDAEDIAQEVFLEVYRSIDRFREDAEISTWIYRISVSKSLDFIRKQKRKKRFGHLKNLFGSQQEQIEQIVDTAAETPHAHLEAQERANILRQAVESLPENQRIAITLNKYEGFSYQEISDIMGTSVSSIESLLHRAKKKLQKKLYQYYR